MTAADVAVAAPVVARDEGARERGRGWTSVVRDVVRRVTSRDWEDWDVSAGTLLVAAACAAASWNALIAVAQAAGFPSYLAWTFPLGVDGLMYIGLRTAYLLRRAPLSKRATVWLALTYSFLVSFTGNGMHSAVADGGRLLLPSWELWFLPWPAVVSGAWLASTVPAVSAMLAIELLIVHRRAREDMRARAHEGRRRRGWRERLGLWLAGQPTAGRISPAPDDMTSASKASSGATSPRATRRSVRRASPDGRVRSGKQRVLDALARRESASWDDEEVVRAVAEEAEVTRDYVRKIRNARRETSTTGAGAWADPERPVPRPEVAR